jgi:hypothetical protein
VGEEASLILRILHGRIPGGALDSVRAALAADYVPAAHRHDGLDRFLIAARPDGEGHALAMLTVWTDVGAAMAAYGGDLSALRTHDGRSHGETLERVDYYEVELNETRRTAGDSRWLRLTAGTVGKGLDADIQRDLRNRLHELEPEAVDAWIGRRVHGGSVEIAFISTWADAPTGRRLEAPIWPDISAQYDTFSVEVFDVLLEGAADR